MVQCHEAGNSQWGCHDAFHPNSLSHYYYLQLTDSSCGSALVAGFSDSCNSSFCLALGCHLPWEYQRMCWSSALCSEAQMGLSPVKWEVMWACRAFCFPCCVYAWWEGVDRCGWCWRQCKAIRAPPGVSVHLSTMIFLLLGFHSYQPFQIKGMQ